METCGEYSCLQQTCLKILLFYHPVYFHHEFYPQQRGQFRPRLKDLIQMNTPRVVMQESKKAFRAIDKKKDLEAAVSALSNLKGVGPAMASGNL